jgi:hypothetical protein
MRLSKPAFATSFKPEPEVRHDSRVLTGFGGLVLFSAYLRAIGFLDTLRERTRGVNIAGLFPLFSMLLLFVLFIAVGGRRQAHLAYFLHDGLLARLAWLKRLPSAATLSRFFSACKAPLVALVAELSALFVVDCARRLGVTETITLDLDGTVVSTRGHQERARKGYNPIRKGARSYRPLTVHLAELGQFLAVINRPGNVPDNASAVGLMRRVIRRLKAELPGVRIRVRQDSAFFDDKLLRMYEAEGASYVVVARMYEKLALVVKERRRWTRVRDGVESFEFCWKMKSWKEARDFAVYRIRLSAREIAERRGEQLDLFRPNDPEYRYVVLCHNFPAGEMPVAELHGFYGGRGGQEKSLGELKSGFAFDVLPSLRYSGNGLWQQLSVLAYNATVGFATEVVRGALRRDADSAGKATRLFESVTATTLRFLCLSVPGHLVNDSGRTVLHLPESRLRRRDHDRYAARIAELAGQQAADRSPDQRKVA